jgi:hypothetical protein
LIGLNQIPLPNNFFDQSNFDRYVAYLKSTSLSNASLKRKLSSLSSFQKFLVKKNLINPPAVSSIIPDTLSPKKNLFLSLFHLPKKIKNGLIRSPQISQTNTNNSKLRNYLIIVSLLIISAGIGYTLYTQIIQRAKTNYAYTTAASPVYANRFLSFQGRLTDTSGNPIISSTNIRFELYDTETVGTGTSLYSSGSGNSQTVIPDDNGIFSVTIGKTHGTQIPNSVFTQNPAVYLQIIAGGETMSPRQPIATVAYAINSESLQGLPPSASGYKDTVMVLDSSGNLNLGETSPTIKATSGTLGIEGQAILIDATNGLDNSNIKIDPINPNGAIQLNTTGTGSSNSIVASNANLTTGNLFYGKIGNTNRGYNFLNFSNFNTGTTQLVTRFSVDASGNTFVGGTLSSTNISIGNTLLTASAANLNLLTGLNSTSGSVIYANGSKLVNTGVGTSGQLLMSNGGGTPTWINSSGVGVTYAASNGLSLVSNTFQLGGLLSQNTDINLSGFNLTFSDAGSTLVSFSNTGNTFYNPTSFTSSGDVSMAYDLNFTNSSGSNINTAGPLSINTGEVFNSSNMTLKTYNAGKIILSSSNLWADGTYVGIGTTNPTHSLDVIGDGSFSGNLTAGNLTVGGTFVSVGTTSLVTNLNADLFDGYQITNFPFVNNASNNTLTRSGSGPYTLGINLANANIWTALQTFTTGIGVSSTANFTNNLNVGGTAYFANYVGIGTTNPLDKLHIYNGNLLVEENYGLNVNDSQSGAINMIRYNASNDQLQIGTSTANGLTGGISFDVAGETGTAMTILNTGNVGIGMTNPTHKLDVGGDGNFSTNLSIGGSLSVTGTSVLGAGFTANATSFVTSLGIGNSLAVIGNVGIGKTLTAGSMAITGNGSIGATLSVAGSESITNNLSIGATLSVAGSESITNNSSIGKTLTTGSLSVTNNANIGATLSVAGSESITNNLSIGGSLSVTGTSVLSAGFTANATSFVTSLGIGNSLAVIGNASIGGTLSVSSNLSVGKTLSAGSIAITGNASIGGTLSVVNQATFAAGIGVTGNSTFTNNLSVGGTLILTNGAQNNYVLTSDAIGNARWAAASGNTTATNGLSVIGSSIGLGGTLTQNTQINTSTFNLSFLGSGNVQSLYLNSSGNVGIGTSSPDTKLHINGSTLNSNGSVQAYTDVADFTSEVNIINGAMRITLPKLASSTMIRIQINGYDYDQGVAAGGPWQAIIGNYNYIDHGLRGAGATITGRSPFNTVRYGNDGTHDVILLGDSSTIWSYPKVTISIQTGYSTVLGWGNGWTITTPNSEIGLVNLLSIPVDYSTNMSGAASFLGSVGIGATSPYTKLQIKGTDGAGANSTSGILAVGTGDGSNSAHLIFGVDTSPSTAYGWINAVKDSSTWANLVLTPSTGSGNVGIGTTNPGQKLDVVGGSIRTDNQLISTVAQGTAPLSIGSSTIVTNLNADLLDGYNAGNFVSIGQTGSLPYVTGATDSTLTRSGLGPYTLGLNLGNTNTWTTLQTFNSGVRIAGANSVDNGSPGLILVSGDDFLYNGNYLNHYGVGFHIPNGQIGSGAYMSGYFGVDLFTGGTNRLSILTGGNVGIGTTNPLYKLDVNGSANIGQTLTTTTLAVTANGTIGGTLAVTGSGWVNNNWAVGGILSSIGRAIFTNGFNVVSNGIGVTGNSTFTNNLNVGGTTIFNSLVGIVGVGVTTNSPLDIGLTRSNTIGSATIADVSAHLYGSIVANAFYDTSDGNYFLNPAGSGSNNVSLSLTSSGSTKFNVKDGVNQYIISDAAARMQNFSNGLSLDTGTSASVGAGNAIAWNSQLFLSTNGNIGIGITNPQATLHVNGGGISSNASNQYNGNLIIQANTGGRIQNSGAQLEFAIPANTDGTNVWGQGRIMTVAGNTSSGNATGEMILGTRRYYSKNGLASAWYYGDDLTINGAGNVGIGTTNPLDELDVSGGNLVLRQNYGIKISDGTNTGQFLTVYGPYNSGFGGYMQTGGQFIIGSGEAAATTYASVNSPGTEDLYLNSDNNIYLYAGIQSGFTDGTADLTIKTNGNVGIGTTSPTKLLTLSGASGTGWLQINDTTNAVISLNNSSDTYPGNWYLQAYASTVRLGYAGTTGLVIDHSNNVGIGTVNPLAKLVVNGGLHVGGDSDPGNDNLLVDGTGQFSGTLITKTPPVVAAITSTTAGAIEVPGVSVGGSAGFVTALHQTTTYSGGYRQHLSLGDYRTASAWGGGFFVGLGGNDSYPTEYYLMSYGGSISHSSGVISTPGDLVVSGNVGIGAAPGYKLEVQGNTVIRGDIYCQTCGNWLSAWINQDVRNGASPTFGIVYGNTGFRVGGNGNTIMDANQFYCNNGSNCHFNYSGTGYTYVGNAAGTTVNGTLTTGSIHLGQWQIFDGGGNWCGSGAGEALAIYNPTQGRCFVIDATGPRPLWENGTVNWSPNGNWFSDAQFKTNITTNLGDGVSAADGLAAINSLNPVSFNWNQLYGSYMKASPEEMAQKQYGFIAQDLEKVLPGYVVTNSDGYKEINYIGLIALTIQGIQQVDAKVVSLDKDLSLTTTGQISVNYNVSDEVLASLGYSGAKNEIENATYSLTDSLGAMVTRISQFGQIISAKIQTGLLAATNVVTKNLVADNIISPQATIDHLTATDATISDTLTAQNVQTTQVTADNVTANDATISGTLYASNIISPQGSFGDLMTAKISSLRDEVKSIIAARTATESALLAESHDWMTSIASDSAKIDGDLALSDNLIVGAKLMVNGDSQLGNAFISGTFTAGEIAIKDNIMETTAAALYIQPSGSGSVDIMNGTLVVAENGDVQINGSLTVHGSLFASLLKADEITTNKLTATDSNLSDIQSNKINIATDSASTVIASDNQINLATNSAQLNSNATAGTTTLPASKTELIIHTDKLTPNSMVYLTPVGSTQNQVVYVKNKVADGSDNYFTIAIDQPLTQDIQVNWWIIN